MALDLLAILISDLPIGRYGRQFGLRVDFQTERIMKSSIACVGLLCLLLQTPQISAAPEAVVYCGSFPCVRLRSPAAGRTAEQRADWAMSLLNKYLGGRVGRFSIVPRGKDAQILLNGEVLLAVTSADARAVKSRDAMALARTWRVSLNTAFVNTRAVK